MTAEQPVDALLVVDVQRGLFGPPSPIVEADRVLAAIDGLLASARRAGALVVFIQHDGTDGAIDQPGHPGWELVLGPRPGITTEIVLRKTGDDAFAETALEELLRGRGVAGVAICGALSEMCLSATARSALARGFRVVLPHDAHGTHDVPSADGRERVPARHVARVAEWALGDDVIIAGHAGSVVFRQP